MKSKFILKFYNLKIYLGTGKTLIARALANECSQGNKKMAFFMRKGADCLSKWVGESERQLRLLFEQAQQMKPSIIFFDEIDGLAPVRSTKQDQIHASIVSTLLALMDGLSDRGEVIKVNRKNIFVLHVSLQFFFFCLLKGYSHWCNKQNRCNRSGSTKTRAFRSRTFFSITCHERKIRNFKDSCQ